MMAIISIIFESNQIEHIKEASNITWLIVLYMVFGASFSAHGLWCYLLTKVSIDKLAPTTLLVPLFGVIAGVLILDEKLSSPMILGGVIMIIGVAIILVRKPKTVESPIDS